LRKSTSECPSQNCSAARPSQNDIDADSLNAAGVTDDWINSARKCSYCGVFYSVETSGEKRVRGYFKAGLIELGNWISSNA